MSEPMIAEVDLSNVQEIVLQGSQRIPVIVNFWSPLNEQSKLANTILEKLATEKAGEFILAKVNIAKENVIAEKFAVTDAPFYKVIVNGDIVTEAGGLLDEAGYRALVEEHGKEDPSEPLRQQAGAAFANGQVDEAMQLLGQASQANPNNFKVHLDLVKMYLHTGHIENAKGLLDKLPDEAQDSPQGKELKGFIFFSEVVEQAPDVQSLQSQIAENADNLDALYALAAYLMLNGQAENSLQTLLKLFTLDRSYQSGLPQKALLIAFEMLTDKAPQLVTMYRRQFQNLLY